MHQQWRRRWRCMATAIVKMSRMSTMCCTRERWKMLGCDCRESRRQFVERNQFFFHNAGLEDSFLYGFLFFHFCVVSHKNAKYSINEWVNALTRSQISNARILLIYSLKSFLPYFICVRSFSRIILFVLSCQNSQVNAYPCTRARSSYNHRPSARDQLEKEKWEIHNWIKFY